MRGARVIILAPHGEGAQPGETQCGGRFCGGRASVYTVRMRALTIPYVRLSLPALLLSAAALAGCLADPGYTPGTGQTMPPEQSPARPVATPLPPAAATSPDTGGDPNFLLYDTFLLDVVVFAVTPDSIQVAVTEGVTYTVHLGAATKLWGGSTELPAQPGDELLVLGAVDHQARTAEANEVYVNLAAGYGGPIYDVRRSGDVVEFMFDDLRAGPVAVRLAPRPDLRLSFDDQEVAFDTVPWESVRRGRVDAGFRLREGGAIEPLMLSLGSGE